MVIGWTLCQTLWVGPIRFAAVPYWCKGNMNPTSTGSILCRSVQLTSTNSQMPPTGQWKKKSLPHDSSLLWKKGTWEDLRWNMKTEQEPFLREVGKMDGWDFRLEMLTIQLPARGYCWYSASLSAISDGLKYYKTQWGHIMFPNEGKIINPNLMWHSLLPLMSFLHLIIIHNLQSWL